MSLKRGSMSLKTKRGLKKGGFDRTTRTPLNTGLPIHCSSVVFSYRGFFLGGFFLGGLLPQGAFILGGFYPRGLMSGGLCRGAYVGGFFRGGLLS